VTKFRHAFQVREIRKDKERTGKPPGSSGHKKRRCCIL